MEITSYLLGKKAGGGSTPTGTIDITENGITNVSSYATANVQVPEKQLEEKSVTISSNTTTLIEPSTGKDGMSSVSVTTNIPEPSGKITITQNGTDIDVSSYASADVNVSGGSSPTSIAEINENMLMYEPFILNYLQNLVPTQSRATYTNNSITLYTPNSNCKWYCIRKKTNDKYNIFWISTPMASIDSVGQYYPGFIIVQTATYRTNNGVVYNAGYPPCFRFSTSFGYTGFNSQEFDSLQEAINGIQSSTTTYTQTSGSGFFGYNELFYSNTLFFTKGDDGVINGEQNDIEILSHNETIEVIS